MSQKNPGKKTTKTGALATLHQAPKVNYLDRFKVQEILCGLKAEPSLCRVNGIHETDGYSSLGAAGGRHSAASECQSIGTEQLLRRNVKRFRGGLVIKAHRRLYHSTLGLRVIKKRKKNAILHRNRRSGPYLDHQAGAGRAREGERQRERERESERESERARERERERASEKASERARERERERERASQPARETARQRAREREDERGHT